MSHIPYKPFNSKAKVQSPCYGCKDRTIEPNCHAACEKYAQFKKDYAAANKNEKRFRRLF